MLRLRGNPLGEDGARGLAEAIQTGSSLLELDVGSCEVRPWLAPTHKQALAAQVMSQAGLAAHANLRPASSARQVQHSSHARNEEKHCMLGGDCCSRTVLQLARNPCILT